MCGNKDAAANGSGGSGSTVITRPGLFDATPDVTVMLLAPGPKVAVAVTGPDRGVAALQQQQQQQPVKHQHPAASGELLTSPCLPKPRGSHTQQAHVKPTRSCTCAVKLTRSWTCAGSFLGAGDISWRFYCPQQQPGPQPQQQPQQQAQAQAHRQQQQQPPHVSMPPPLSPRQQQLHTQQHVWGTAVSLYDLDPLTGQRNGDPIADCFAAIAYQQGAVMALADGVNWGERPKAAATGAVLGFCASLHQQLAYAQGTTDVCTAIPDLTGGVCWLTNLGVAHYALHRAGRRQHPAQY